MVLEGRARVTVGDESRVLDQGGLAFVPVNVMHGFETVGDTNLRIMQVITWLAGTVDALSRRRGAAAAPH